MNNTSFPWGNCYIASDQWYERDFIISFDFVWFYSGIPFREQGLIFQYV